MFIKASLNEFKINPLYCVRLPGYTWECGLKYTGINLQTLQDKDMILVLENNIRGCISSVMGDMLYQMKTKRFHILMLKICIGRR